MGTLRGFGSGEVGRSVLRALIEAGPHHRFSAWIPEQWGWSADQFGRGCHITSVRAGLAAKALLENVTLRRELRAGAHDALFSLTDTSLPRCGVPHLLMVQQPYLAYGYDALDFPLSRSFHARQSLIAAYFRVGIPSVSRFTVQTRAMQQRLSARWSIDPSRIDVVPSALALEVAETTPTPDDSPYVCYVASPSPHKNFDVLADMMAALPSSLRRLTCRVTVLPEHVPTLVERARSRGVLPRFEFLGPTQRPLELMRGAIALVMPSKLETFGLPYYEAMSVGCPVVAADRDFSREACGDAGRYAPADDGDAFAAHVTALADADVRELASVAGRARARSMNRPRDWLGHRYLEILTRLV